MRSIGTVAGYVLLTTLLGFGGTRAAAQPIADHLHCYKVKDAQPKASYTADLGGLAAHTGCLIKVPGNLLCVEAAKTNVSPAPQGGTDDSGAAGRFLCYKVKCPKVALAPLQWHDQFGDRQLTPSAQKIVCAPEIVATTSTTVASSTTTTTTGGNLGAACSVPAQCASGFCVTGVCCATSCAMQPSATCGTTGSCQPNGTACQQYAAGTVCAAASCNGDTFTSASTCDGSGTCNQGTMSSCSPYVCTVGGCKTSCTTTADCVAPFTCSGGVCQSTTTTTATTTTTTLPAGSLCAQCTIDTDCPNFGQPTFHPCASFPQGQRCTRPCTIDAECPSPSNGHCVNNQCVCTN